MKGLFTLVTDEQREAIRYFEGRTNLGMGELVRRAIDYCYVSGSSVVINELVPNLSGCLSSILTNR